MLNFQDALIKLLVVAIWFANADSKGKITKLFHIYHLFQGVMIIWTWMILYKVEDKYSASILWVLLNCNIGLIKFIRNNTLKSYISYATLFDNGVKMHFSLSSISSAIHLTIRSVQPIKEEIVFCTKMKFDNYILLFFE